MPPESPQPSASDSAPGLIDATALKHVAATTMPKPDPDQYRYALLFRVIEVSRQPNGRLAKQGQIWHSDLDQARRFGRVLAANSVAQKVQVADANGTVLETIPPPPPGAPSSPGWGDWRHMPLPPAPPAPRVKRKAVAKRLPAAGPSAPPPTVLPLMEPESEVERTSTLTP